MASATLNVKITGRTTFGLDCMLAIRLMRIAAWLIGCNIEIVANSDAMADQVEEIAKEAGERARAELIDMQRRGIF